MGKESSEGNSNKSDANVGVAPKGSVLINSLGISTLLLPLLIGVNYLWGLARIQGYCSQIGLSGVPGKLTFEEIMVSGYGMARLTLLIFLGIIIIIGIIVEQFPKAPKYFGYHVRIYVMGCLILGLVGAGIGLQRTDGKRIGEQALKENTTCIVTLADKSTLEKYFVSRIGDVYVFKDLDKSGENSELIVIKEREIQLLQFPIAPKVASAENSEDNQKTSS